MFCHMNVEKRIYAFLALLALLLVPMSCVPDSFDDDGPQQEVPGSGTSEKPGTGDQPGTGLELSDDGAPLRLNVVGRYLVDETGNTVNLHGFGQTYSPFFNENAWGNYDVSACLKYNQRMIDAVLAAGWEMDFIRMHMDPY